MNPEHDPRFPTAKRRSAVCLAWSFVLLVVGLSSCRVTSGETYVSSPSGTFLVVASEDPVAEAVARRADEMLDEIETYFEPGSELLVRIHVSSTDRESRNSRRVVLPIYGVWIHLPESYHDRMLMREVVHAAIESAPVDSWPHAFREGLALFLCRHSDLAAHSSAEPAAHVLSAAGLSERPIRIRYQAEGVENSTLVSVSPGGRRAEFESLEGMLELSEHEYESLARADREAIAGTVFALLEGIEAWSGVASYLQKYGTASEGVRVETLLRAAGLQTEEEFWTMLPALARVMAGNVLFENELATRALVNVDVDPTRYSSVEQFLAEVDPYIEFEGLLLRFDEFDEFPQWAEGIWGSDEPAQPRPASFWKP